MAAKPVADFGLAAIQVKKGRGVGVEPAASRGQPDGEAALNAVDDAAQTPAAPQSAPQSAPPPQEQHLTAGQNDVERREIDALQKGRPPSGLSLGRRPSDAVPTKNVQVRLREPIADALAAMAFHERTKQQPIMERAITDVVEAWLRRRMAEERGRGD